MLVLTFRVAEVPYAVAVRRVVEVVPRVGLRALPHAPGHLAGLLRYRGGVVPVVDLGLLMGGAACRDRLDTRIILVDAGRRGGGLVGLVAERVDDVRRGRRVAAGRRRAGDRRRALPRGRLRDRRRAPAAHRARPGPGRALARPVDGAVAP